MASGRFLPDRQEIDFLGINYYSRSVVRNDPDQWIERAGRVRQSGATHTTLEWEVFPRGLTDILTRVTASYGRIPIYITENGAAFYDPPKIEGDRLEDPLRIDYLRRHIVAAREALDLGVDLRGYFAWSLLDNFEWGFGFSKRFGIVHVDYDTQKRTIKSSGRFYAEVIRGHGVP